MNKTNEKRGQSSANYGLTILFTALKCVAVFVILLFYLEAIMVGLVPKSAAKFFDDIGLDGPASTCYEQIYKRSQKSIDLYNLVERQLRSGNYKKAANNITKLLERPDYKTFATKLNKAAIEKSEKKYLVYVADVNSYLLSQRVIALYRSGDKASAKQRAIEDLYSDDAENVYSFAFGGYVDCLLLDEALNENGTLGQVLDALYKEIPEGKVMDIQSRIQTKLARVDAAATSEVDRIMRVYTSLKINYTLLNIYEAQGDTVLSASCRERIEMLRTNYESLIV